jgi:hypothetical protein
MGRRGDVGIVGQIVSNAAGDANGASGIQSLYQVYRDVLNQAYPSIINAALMDLSSGTGGGVQGYEWTVTRTGYPEDGLVITSSEVSYNNANAYRLEHVVDNSNSSSSNLTYWLVANKNPTTLVFDFSSTTTVRLDKMVVYPRCRSDTSANWTMQYSPDNSTWYDLSDENGVISETSSTSTPYGTAFPHVFSPPVNVRTYPYVRFSLTQNGSYGVLLNEIEVWAG